MNINEHVPTQRAKIGDTKRSYFPIYAFCDVRECVLVSVFVRMLRASNVIIKVTIDVKIA